MAANLQQVDRFERGRYPHKYTAILKSGRKVRFGHQAYQHYRDRVPKRMGGGLWSKKDHNDPARRQRYRKRHAGVKTASGRAAYRVKYSPSWFSYHYLWIVYCAEYRRVVLSAKDLYYRPRLRKKAESDTTVVTEKELGADLLQVIPREIRWEIERDYRHGAQLLADRFGKPVIVSIGKRTESKLRKLNEGYHIPAGAGAFERKIYARSAPPNEVFYPATSDPEADTKIHLEIAPRRTHYTHTAEQRTRIVHDYCEGCQHAGRGCVKHVRHRQEVVAQDQRKVQPQIS